MEKHFIHSIKNQQFQSIPKCPSDLVSIQSKNSQIDIKSFIGKNQDYYDHIAGKCICFTCECGKCKCEYQIAKIQIKMPKTSSYQNAYGQHQSQKELQIPCTSKWHSHSMNNQQIIKESNVQENFKQGENYNLDLQSKQELKLKQMSYDIPKSNYQFNFTKYDISNIPPAMPNLNQLFQTKGVQQNGVSNYQYDFIKSDNYKRGKCFQFPDNLKSMQLPSFKSTYQQAHTGNQDQQLQTVRISNKQIINDRSRYQPISQQKQENPFQKNIFISETNRCYSNKKLIDCPSFKKKMEKTQQEQQQMLHKFQNKI